MCTIIITINQVKIIDYSSYEKLIYPYLFQNIGNVDKSFISFETTVNAEKVALVIINVFDNINEAKIVSFVVSEKFRKQGIGSSLLRYVENYLQEKGINTVKIDYFGDIQPDILKNCQRFLQTNDWNNPIMSQYMHNIDLQSLKNFRTLHRLKLPTNFTIIRIDEMNSSMIKQIESGSDVWYKKEYYPLNEDVLMDYSLILLEEQKVAGWVVVKHINEHTVHIDKLFVRSEYRRTTRPFSLFFQLLISLPYRYGLYVVNGSNDHMLNLLETRIKPYLLDTKVLHTTYKDLNMVISGWWGRSSLLLRLRKILSVSMI